MKKKSSASPVRQKPPVSHQASLPTMFSGGQSNHRVSKRANNSIALVKILSCVPMLRCIVYGNSRFNERFHNSDFRHLTMSLLVHNYVDLVCTYELVQLSM